MNAAQNNGGSTNGGGKPKTGPKRGSKGEPGGAPGPDPAPKRRDWPGYDDFDDLIRDREYDFDELDELDDRSAAAQAGAAGAAGGGDFGWEDPNEAFRRFSARAGADGPKDGDRSAADLIARVIELLGGLATEALPAETRRQIERMIRDLLVVLRDTIDKLIDRLDEHNLDDDVEIEEIKID